MKKLKILIVDDNQIAADVMARLMTKMGHEATTAYSVKQTLEAGDFRPDFIFLDINLGSDSGYELARQLKHDERFSSAVLVALTGYSGPGGIERALNSGFDYHLTKPAGAAEIAEILNDTET